MKHGKESGFVEITLFDDKAKGGRHPVIRRSLSASSSASEWTINRRTVLEKDVSTCMSGDDLCMCTCVGHWMFLLVEWVTLLKHTSHFH